VLLLRAPTSVQARVGAVHFHAVTSREKNVTSRASLEWVTPSDDDGRRERRTDGERDGGKQTALVTERDGGLGTTVAAAPTAAGGVVRGGGSSFVLAAAAAAASVANDGRGGDDDDDAADAEGTINGSGAGGGGSEIGDDFRRSLLSVLFPVIFLNDTAAAANYDPSVYSRYDDGSFNYESFFDDLVIRANRTGPIIVRWKLPRLKPPLSLVRRRDLYIRDLCRLLDANELDVLDLSHEAMLMTQAEWDSVTLRGLRAFRWDGRAISPYGDTPLFPWLRPLSRALQRNSERFGAGSALRAVWVSSHDAGLLLSETLTWRYSCPTIRSIRITGAGSVSHPPPEFCFADNSIPDHRNRYYPFKLNFQLNMVPGLRELRFTNYTHMTWTGLSELSDELQVGNRVEKLVLDRCQIGRIGEDAICGAMAEVYRNCALQELDLSNNIIGDRGCLVLADAIIVNPSYRLLRINLRGNSNITDAGARHIFDALQSHPHYRLESIDFSFTGVSQEMQAKIDLVLLQNRHLRARFPQFATTVDANASVTIAAKWPWILENLGPLTHTPFDVVAATLTVSDAAAFVVTTGTVIEDPDKRLWLARAIDLRETHLDFLYLALKSEPDLLQGH